MKDSLGNKIPKTAVILRHTEVGGFRSCPRKWYLESHNGLNLEPVVKNRKLSEGICWHAGLESHYNGEGFTVGFDKAFSEEVEALVEATGESLSTNLALDMEEGFDPEACSELQKEVLERAKLAYTLYEHYQDWAEAEATPSDSEFKVVFTERRFVVPLMTNTGHRSRTWIAAKLDGVVSVGDTYYILEHKYVSKSTRVNDPDHLALDLQMGIQILVLQEYLRANYPGKKVGGAIYNLTRKQLPGPRVKAPLFGRHLVYRTQKELAILADDLYRDSKLMRNTKKLSLPDVMHNPQPWGGICTWGCAFRDVCESVNKAEDYPYLLTFYKKREKSIWDLLKEEMEE